MDHNSCLSEHKQYKTIKWFLSNDVEKFLEKVYIKVDHLTLK